jgi:hypothetical protein
MCHILKHLIWCSLEEIWNSISTILITKVKILVATDTCDINVSVTLNKWQKTINHKKLHMACTITLIVAYHLQLQECFNH